MTLYAALVGASQRVAATSSRSEKVAILADYLRRVEPAEVQAAVALLLGRPRHGPLGVGWATVATLSGAPHESSVTELSRPPDPRESSVTKPESSVTEPGVGSLTIQEGRRQASSGGVSSLTIGEVDEAMGRLAGVSGAGSQGARQAVLSALFARASSDEADHLRSVLMGEIRQGANDGVLNDAVAKAAGRPLADVRRAAMLLGDLGAAAARALGGEPLAGLGLRVLTGVLRVLTGVLPMLASTSTSVADALAATGPASVEAKLDGARIQVHRHAGTIRVFTRSLREIGDAVPSITAAVAALPGGDLVLDGEALGLDDDGHPLAFQDTMSGQAALRPFFFDVLHADGASMIDEPLMTRKQVLAATVPPSLRLASIDDPTPDAAEAFAERVLADGHEGVMVKSLNSAYDAGRRGKAWRKVKPVHTLDLVVLAVEWGSGRRSGWLSNIHLGAADGHGGFVMVGKTFKGMTDDMLRWQTDAFQRLAIGTDGYVVHVRPEVVVEIAVDGVQRSSRYPGGVALRFARVRRYRADKQASEADHIDRVRAMLARR